MKAAMGSVLAMVLFSSAGLAAPPQQAGSSTVALSKEQVLDRWADALGGRQNLQRVRTLHLRGTTEAGGMKGTYERWVTSRGELRTAIDLSGAYRQTVIFDGRQAWAQDSSGTVRDLSGDILRTILSNAYEASDSFLFADRLPGQVELVGEDAGQNAYVLRLEPLDGAPITVYLDRRSFLPQREETRGPMGARVLRFADWRDFGGLKFPGTVQQSSGDAVRPDAVFHTEQVEIDVPVTAGLFARPGSTPEPVRFPAGAHQAVIPAQVYGDHIFVPVQVNGRPAAWFFFDSGAAITVVNRALAEKAGLTLAGEVRTQGTGQGSAGMALAEKVTLDLPGLQVPPHSVAVWDLSPLQPMVGRPWDGTLGYDLLSRVVARVDYEHQQVTLYDPATFVPDAHAVALPVTFLGNLPVVPARILLPGQPPVDTACAIDSGADGFHLTAPFTNAHHVLEAVQKRIGASSEGVGGSTRDFAGRIAGLQLGPYLLREPIAAFSPDVKEGLLASPDIGALVGGEILQRFTVTFDLPHHRILLEPNRRFADPFQADESGLSLLAKDADFRTFEVDAVEPGSPAALAGVQVGDVVTAVGGRPARELDREQISKRLQRPGHKVPLDIQRNGKAIRLILRLRERM